MGVTTNIINGGLECNRPGDSRMGDQRPFGLDAAVAKSTAPVSTSVTARVDRKGRTCAELPKRACKKKNWCTFNTSSRICEDAAVAPGMAEAAESVSRMDRKGRTCADYGKRLCKKRKWCRFDPDGQTCEEKEAGYLRG